MDQDLIFGMHTKKVTYRFCFLNPYIVKYVEISVFVSIFYFCLFVFHHHLQIYKNKSVRKTILLLLSKKE